MDQSAVICAICGNSWDAAMESASICVICGQYEMVRWVNPAMAFAMFLAVFAIFAVKQRWEPGWSIAQSVPGGPIYRSSVLKRSLKVPWVWARFWVRNPIRTTRPSPCLATTIPAFSAMCSSPMSQPLSRRSRSPSGCRRSRWHGGSSSEFSCSWNPHGPAQSSSGGLGRQKVTYRRLLIRRLAQWRGAGSGDCHHHRFPGDFR